MSRAGARTALLATALVALVAGCDDGVDERRWIELARGFEPRAPAVGALLGELDGRDVTVADVSPGGLRVEIALGPAEFRAEPVAGVFSAPCPLLASGMSPRGGEALSLAVGDQPFVFRDVTLEPATPENRRAGTFSVVGGRLLVDLGPGGEPRPARLFAFVDTGAGEPVGDDVVWRVACERYAADGFLSWPAAPATVEVTVPKGGATLRFCTLTRSLGPATGLVAFRIRAGAEADTETGTVLFRTAQVADPTPRVERHVVALASEGPTTLSFEVAGGPAIAAWLTPVVGPADVGGYAERPWGPDRPDVVVFLADTFRADNLGVYGGEHGLTPTVDAFASEGVVFERAWAPSSWTLPSHASLFTGLLPHQHGAVGRLHGLSRELVTVAERFREAGYRTGAITDAGYVTRSAGLDQGFAWFDAHLEPLVAKIDSAVEAFLAADDGRPVFLFVQTYRTHTPYEVSEATRRRLGGRFDFADDFRALRNELFGIPAELVGQGWTVPKPPGFPAAEPLRRYHHLYLGTVADLDRGYGVFLEALERHGLRERAFTVFTSDHGEAFGEHGEVGHSNGVWEEHVRVPLLVRGPGLAPGTSSAAASLVDLPRTLCALAGVPPAAAWGGADLFAPTAARPLFAFECNHDGDPSSMAWIDGARKVITPSRADAGPADVEHAYDLAADPAESDESARESDWPAELLLRHAAAARTAFEARAGPGEARLTPAEERRLDALGYGRGGG